MGHYVTQGSVDQQEGDQEILGSNAGQSAVRVKVKVWWGGGKGVGGRG